jgi:hypothetical protein
MEPFKSATLAIRTLSQSHDNETHPEGECVGNTGKTDVLTKLELMQAWIYAASLGSCLFLFCLAESKLPPPIPSFMLPTSGHITLGTFVHQHL